ncbi:tail fiber domain-containing protein [bacterium]|nr:tail fiber domain-containing protein [bacterium]
MSKQTDLINIPDAITVSGSNVGIGTSSPVAPIDVTRSGNGTIAVLQTTGSHGFEISAPSSTTLQIASKQGSKNLDLWANTLSFSAGGAERMRIDSSGNVIVGGTSLGANDSVSISPSGYIDVSGNGTGGYYNREGSDGEILRLLKDGTTVGSIGSYSSSYLYIGSTGGSDTHIGFVNGHVRPATATGAPLDNDLDLGHPIARWDDIYATNGTIQTSDFNEKQDIASLTATEMLVGKRISALFKTFRWKDSVAENGDNARTHTGVIAQDVQAAFTAEGLDAGDYALFISSTWWETQTEVPAVEAVAEVLDEDGNVTTEAVEAKDAYTRTDTYDTEEEAPEGATSKTRMGIRYPELLSFVAAYNEQRFASIEARLTALEA